MRESTTQYTRKRQSNKNCWFHVLVDSNRKAEEFTLKSWMNQYSKTTLDDNNGIGHHSRDGAYPRTELCQCFGAQGNWPKMWLSHQIDCFFPLMTNKHQTKVQTKKWSKHSVRYQSSGSGTFATKFTISQHQAPIRLLFQSKNLHNKYQRRSG